MNDCGNSTWQVRERKRERQQREWTGRIKETFEESRRLYDQPQGRLVAPSARGEVSERIINQKFTTNSR